MALRLIKCCLEFWEKDKIIDVQSGQRGIYVLYKDKSSRSHVRKRYDALYVGMAGSSIRARLRNHARRKNGWTHFSAYIVWPNITKAEISELEGLFRHLYRCDGRASVLNIQRRYKALTRIKSKDSKNWQESMARALW